MLRLVVAAFAALGLLTTTTTPSFACACCGTWKVVRVAENDVLNIRTGPSVRYRKIGAIPSGSGCVIKSNKCRRNWCRISYADQTGWVNVRYLSYIK